jgi:hypothetical protein
LEISGSQPTGFHDAALLYQHVTGLLPDIANVPAPAVPQFISNITVEKDSVPLAGDIYRYRLKAFGLAGLISATVNLKVDTGVVQKVQAVYVNSGAALIHGRLEGDNYSLYMSSARPVTDSVFDWVTLVVVHKSGQTGTGLSLPPVIQASLNENLFCTAGNCITITSPSAGQVFETGTIMNAYQSDNTLVVDIRTSGSYGVVIMDRLGRVINKGQGQGAQTYEFAGNGLAPGVYFVRVTAQGVSHVRKVVVR